MDNSDIMDTGHVDPLPSALYVFVDEADNTVLAALQEQNRRSPPFPMLVINEELLPRYVHLARAYGQLEGHSYRLFKFSSCVEIDMKAIPPVAERPALRLVAGGARGATA